MTRHSPIRSRRKPRRGPSDVPAGEWRNPEYRRFLREEGRRRGYAFGTEVTP